MMWEAFNLVMARHGYPKPEEPQIQSGRTQSSQDQNGLNIRPKRKEKKSDIVDDHDLTGFAPPHKTRAIISIVVAAENILLLLYAFMNEKSIRGVSIGSGKLALANLFPLFLFGSHEIILVKVLRHSQQQVLWAHTLFAWIAWYEMEVHVATSLFLVSGLNFVSLGWQPGAVV
ncbi:hypothetical protein FOC1_g10000298 [Fusarium oxysporum f. sp. cubense race 1]|uniref:Uncharacterized protein n=1 Tax=Fusarium oxysporum f. sp. cubense (strain race 1) TaxID=1229664 RepID=N4TVV2_FUSC1|nr:hypothetical protein FOC1_g10000298 [Fusarium oxysporum f. sp. cubense race 1]